MARAQIRDGGEGMTDLLQKLKHVLAQGGGFFDWVEVKLTPEELGQIIAALAKEPRDAP